MKFILIYTQLFFMAFVSMAQVSPWKFVPTSVKHTINISSAHITVDNVSIQAGDIVGVFYDSSGQLACGGYAVWPATKITAYGNDSVVTNGFAINEPFQFKIWEKNNNCIVDTGTIIQFQYIPGTFNDSIFFKSNGTSKLITLNGSKKQIYYSKNNYCLGDPDPLPIKKGAIPDVTYSSQTGLNIDVNTGKINIAASTPGTYTVYFHTSLCLKANSFMVKIKLNLDDLGVTVVKSTCTTDGQVTIDENTILCGVTRYQIRIRNVINGQNIFPTGPTTSLADGTYELFITDTNLAEVKWVNSLVVTKECKDLILAPNSTTGRASTYFISQQGKARIYDRFGLLRKEMSIPANWDATDNSGNQVAMGEYVIICNESEQIVITVIK
jgi:hypothetical protein